MERKLLIDGANLRSGGAITHLTEILNHVKADEFPFKGVTIVGGSNTMDKISERPWLRKVSHRWLNGGLFYILLWKLMYLKRSLLEDSFIFFSPAGTYVGYYKPYCVMSRNMLIFDSKESKRYGVSLMRLKFWLLRKVQTKSFERADIIIFISEYAKSTIAPFLKRDITSMPVIYHGINRRFENTPKAQLTMAHYSSEKPFKLLYVSPITVYKHQWVLIKSVARLRKAGYSLRLDLVGDGYAPSLRRFYKELSQIKDNEQFITYYGKVPYESIHDLYKDADGFVYCSTCENMPNILIEAMSSGLPIACSNFQPMPEFLGESEFYLDPTNEQNVYEVLKRFLDNPKKRYEAALKSYNNSQKYSWENCAKKTFDTLASISKN